MKASVFTGIFAAGAIVAILLTAGCTTDNDGNGGGSVPVRNVTLNKTALTLVVGQQASLVARVTPTTADDKTVTWASDNDAVAGVNDNGNVTAKSEGTAKITVTTTDGEKKAHCNVAVIPVSANHTTPEEIEAYIDEYWQGYGYSEKPTKYIALSFDDGPSEVTQNLLTALDTAKVKATFFLIGQNIRSRQAFAKAIFDAGHEIGNHSDGFDSLGNTAVAATTTSLNAASAAIKAITGEDPVLFRAPNVDYGANLTQVCTNLNLAIIGVSLWSNDWQNISTEQTITNVINNPKDGDIINCHELANTVAAVPAIVDGLRAKGFWIMTVGELAVIKGKTLEAGKRYDSIK